MKEYDIYIYYIYILYIYIIYIYHLPRRLVSRRRCCRSEEDGNRRQTESDGLASGPSGFCARTRMHKGVLEESWRCSQDYLGYLFDIVRHFQGWLAVQLNLMITWSRVLMWIVVEHHCFLSFRLASELESCCLMLFDAVCFGQSFKRITGWSVKHVAASLGLALSQPGTSGKTWALWWAATENAAYHWVLLGDPGRGKGNAGCACP